LTSSYLIFYQLSSTFYRSYHSCANNISKAHLDDRQTDAPPHILSVHEDTCESEKLKETERNVVKAQKRANERARDGERGWGMVVN